ncbi:hypothetical protein [Hymenobacter siberiensis]|nr:hypothetical protein [Hymenobacter siberiensis]
MKKSEKFFFGMHDKLSQLVAHGLISNDTKVKAMSSLRYDPAFKRCK